MSAPVAMAITVSKPFICSNGAARSHHRLRRRAHEQFAKIGGGHVDASFGVA